jgi:hypothetical protein
MLNRLQSLAPMRKRQLLWLLGTVFGLMGSVLAQQSTVPTISFTCDFPGSDPSHYGISVFFDGRATYISDGKVTKDSDSGGPVTAEFTLLHPTVTHIFDLAKQAHYFEGSLDSKRKNIASTGEKTLMYKDGQRSNVANYNYTNVSAAQELTTLFQQLSLTLEFGRRLEYDYRYQKLALDEELKLMDDLASRGELAEVTVLAPILNKLVNDQSVINPVRARAQRLLEHAGAGGK